MKDVVVGLVKIFGRTFCEGVEFGNRECTLLLSDRQGGVLGYAIRIDGNVKHSVPGKDEICLMSEIFICDGDLFVIVQCD